MKGDRAALLDDLVRYGAQLFFPFLRALSVVIRLETENINAGQGE